MVRRVIVTADPAPWDFGLSDEVPPSAPQWPSDRRARLARTHSGAPFVGCMTTVRLGAGPPCDASLEVYAARSALPRPFNHGFMPRGPRPEAGLRLIELSGKLGSGRACYRRACRHLRAWQMHDGSETTGVWTDGSAVYSRVHN